MAEKGLAERMQSLLDKDENYAELCTKVDKQQAKSKLLDNQYSQHQEQIRLNEKSLAECNAKIHEVEPAELESLKVKIDKLTSQITADKNWLLKLSNHRHDGVIDETRIALESLQRRRMKIFYECITSLRGQQAEKAENCLKQATAYYRFWCGALDKVTNANHIRIVGKDDAFIRNDAKILPLDFEDAYGKFNYSVLCRRYNNG